MTTETETVNQRLDRAIASLGKAGRQLHDHQNQGITWMMAQEAKGVGGILADDPGLGKTIQALSLVATSTPGSSTLVVVPASIITQWKTEAVRLLGEYAVYVHHGSRNRTLVPRARLVITTYGVIRSEPTLQRIRWNRIFLDEIHEIKSRRSKISKAVMALDSPLRWGLSGTPVQNTSEETGNLFRFVLGLPSDTREQLDVPQLIRTHLMRRRKEVVLKDKIPELEVENVPIPFDSEREQKFYEKVERNVKREFNSLADQCLTAQEENVQMFELLLRLRQAAQHPQLVLDGYSRKYGRDLGKWQDKATGKPQASSKHLALLDMLGTHPDEAAIIFSHFTTEMDILERFLASHGIETLRLDGKLSNNERDEVLARCAETADGPPPVTLIQIKAGGVGLNLQAFSRVYITSPDWNPCNEIQAMARAHRLGQTRRVVVKKLVLQKTIIDNHLDRDAGTAPVVAQDKDKDKDNAKDQVKTTIDQRILVVQDRKRNLMADLLSEESLRSDAKQSMGLTSRDYGRLLR